MSFRLQDSKTRGGAVRVPARIEAIIDPVRSLAEQTGLDSAMIESVYRHLIEQSIEGKPRY